MEGRHTDLLPPRVAHEFHLIIPNMQMRQKLEDEKRALVSFMTDIDTHISSVPSIGLLHIAPHPPSPPPSHPPSPASSVPYCADCLELGIAESAGESFWCYIGLIGVDMGIRIGQYALLTV